MSSTITIGFLDRTRVCIQAEFTPPIADDERRELLIHATLLTGRAFASLTPDRQRSFAGVLRDWVATGFEACPLQTSESDPMVCPHRFASTFLAPVREYALATNGCGREAGGIDYFLPMAAAAFLRYVADTDDDPDELLKPALALCAAATIHPITVGNHFEMAAASLPKVEPIIDRTVTQQDLPSSDHSPALPLPVVVEGEGRTSRHLRETRRSLIVSACLAAVLIVLGVQYLSTREPKAGGELVAVRSVTKPQSIPEQSQAGEVAHPSSEGGLRSAPTTTDRNGTWIGAPIAAPHMPPKSLSPTARAYLRTMRDLAENSLAQVEVMLAVADRTGFESEESADTLEYGVRQLRDWRRQFASLSPPGNLARQHGEIAMVLKELGGIAGLMRSLQSKPPSDAIRDRLSAIHAGLERVLRDANGF